MNRCLRFLISAVILLNIALSPAVVSAGYTGQDIGAVINDTAGFLQNTVTEPGITMTGGDWTVFGLARCGFDPGTAYWAKYYHNASVALVRKSGVLSEIKYSEYSRVILAMAAIGANPEDVAGYDLTEPILNYYGTINQGINGPMFALIALNSIGRGGESVCDKYVDYILSRKLPDGGFALTGTISDPDTTAMALTALSHYQNRPDVAEAIGGALERLSALQRDTGGYTSYSHVNSESVSQVIIALCSLGITHNDERFVKNGNSLLDNLLTYYKPGHGFEHEAGGGGDLMATEQAMLALTAIWREMSDKNGLYDLSDASAAEFLQMTGLPGKHEDVTAASLKYPDASFSDARGDYETAIIGLAERGIVSGYPDGTFAPDKTISRAEFAAIIVRSLGLYHPGLDAFNDVTRDDWFYSAVSAAFEYGIVTGRAAGVFDPDGTITRQEAAVMLARASALCGLFAEFDDDGVRNILAQFKDYKSAEPWSTQQLAFCYYFGIFDDADIEIRPGEPILRAEMAQSVFNMLKNARLI